MGAVKNGKVKCPKCGERNLPRSRVCAFCGSPLNEPKTIVPNFLQRTPIYPNDRRSYLPFDIIESRQKRKLKVFICHSSKDKQAVKDLTNRLSSEQDIAPWLDEQQLLPGMEWDLEIQKAVRESDVVLVCLSHNSTTKNGYVHREIRFALDIADEKPERKVFIIPLKLEECEVPMRLSKWQWLNYLDEGAYDKLLKSFRRVMRGIEDDN